MPSDTPDHSEFLRLASFSNSIEAGFVLELLLNNGIQAVLKGANFGALEPLLMPGGFSEVHLLVHRLDLDRATELYEAFFTRGDAIDSDVDPT
ncbi:MAG: DUF2007 domain-containing protein [Acidobacteriota bacterium]